jgi:hypothetical protein
MVSKSGIVRIAVGVVAVVVAVVGIRSFTGSSSGSAPPAARAAAGVMVANVDPFGSCGGGPDVAYPGAQLEPTLAVDSNNPRHFVGAFLQDTNDIGGSRGVVAVTSFDGGRTMSQVPLPVTRCAPGGLPFDEAAFPWVSMGPDGTVYAIVNVFNQAGGDAIAATVSADGGATWTNQKTILDTTAPGEYDERDSVTADPRRPGTAYAVWDHTVRKVGDNIFTDAGMLSITHDYGRTWSTPQTIVAPEQLTMTDTHRIVVNPHTGTLYDFYNDIHWTSPSLTVLTSAIDEMISSTDGGATWSNPVIITGDTGLVDADPRAPGVELNTFTAGFIEPAVDPVTDELYLICEGSDYNNWSYDQIQIVTSTDHGQTWSLPEVVSPPGVLAFDPSIAVNAAGQVAVSYYDVRTLTASAPKNTVPTTAWLAVSPRGGHDFSRESLLASAFDFRRAPNVFLGWYQGLAASGSGFRALFTTTNSDPYGTATGVHTTDVAGTAGSTPPGYGGGPAIMPKGRDPRTIAT